MAQIDIEIEEYLDEVKTQYLFNELKKRKDFKDYIQVYFDEQMPEYIIPEFDRPDQVLNFLKIVLKLKPWHDKERIIKEINEL